jgi:hypothetical protein
MIGAYFINTVTRIRSIRDNRGREVTNDILEFQCRFESSNRAIFSQGEDKVSKAMLFCDPIDIQVGDRIYDGVLESGESLDNKQIYPVLHVDRIESFSVSHLEVYLG